MAEVFGLGILIDIVDEEWMSDTLPDEGKPTTLPNLFFWSTLNLNVLLNFVELF